MARRPSLPLPPLLEALDDWQHLRTGRQRQEVVESLQRLTDVLELKGAALHVEAPPLAEITAASGTLAGLGADDPAWESAHELRAADRVPLGRLLTDPPDSPAVGATIAAVSAAVAATRSRARAERAEANLAALDEAVRGIAGLLELTAVLQGIVDRVRELVDAEYAALAILNEEGGLERFVTSGLSDEEYRRIGPLPKGRGLLGVIVDENRSLRIRDIETDPHRHGFPPNHPPMHSFLGAPISIKGRSIGRLYLTNKRDAAEFSEADQELVERFALHAGIAIENARLHERVQRLAIVEERERIGRDLHDGIIQRIYGITLSLDDVPELVEPANAEAAERVDRAIDALHDTIRELRTFIFGLGPALDDEESLTEALEALAADVRQNIPVTLHLPSDAGFALSSETIGELVSIAREALSNVVRHAAARSATVRLTVGPGELSLEVSDDGRGFDVSRRLPPTHRGLTNMRARAERLGTLLRIESDQASGTRIIVTVPRPVAMSGGPAA
jgi:signal transduction histidine kinase